MANLVAGGLKASDRAALGEQHIDVSNALDDLEIELIADQEQNVPLT